MKHIYKMDFAKVFGIIALITVIGFAFIACENPSGGDDDIVPSALQGTWLGTFEGYDDKVVFTDSTLEYSYDNTDNEEGGVSTIVIEFDTVKAENKNDLFSGDILGFLNENKENLAELGITEAEFDDVLAAIFNDTLSAYLTAKDVPAEIQEGFMEELGDLKEEMDAIKSMYSYTGEVTSIEGDLFNDEYTVGEAVDAGDFDLIFIFVDGTLAFDGENYEK